MWPIRWLGCMFFLIFLLPSESGGLLGADTVKISSPSDLVQNILDKQIKQVHISDADHPLLEALAHTGIEVMIGIANEQLEHIAEFQEEADAWVHANILRFIPATYISYIIAGNEVTSSTSHALFLLPAMQNLRSALVAAKLHDHIKISSSHSIKLIPEPFPPSRAEFSLKQPSLMEQFLEFLQFLNETESSFFLNIDMHPLGDHSFNPIILLNDSSVIDVMVDAAYHSMKKLGFLGIPVTVSEFQGLKIGDTLIYRTRKLDAQMNDFSNVDPRRILATGSSVGEFCVANPNANQTALQAGLNYACGQSPSSCTNIQPGGPCYKANNIVALASYAYNDYYHKFAATGATCDFSGTAMTTTTDPSYGSCIFAGSSQSGTGQNSSVTPNASPPSTFGGLSPPGTTGGLSPPTPFSNSSFGPSSFVPIGSGSISSSRALRILYLVPVMLCFFFDM